VLKGIPKEIGPELLRRLAEMGHGDELAIVDANYPAYAAGPPVVFAGGVGAPEMLAAVLKLLPLDTFTEANAFPMMGDDGPPAILTEFERVLTGSGEEARIQAIDRFAFYQRAQKARVIVATGEGRAYGCILIRKGVIFF